MHQLMGIGYGLWCGASLHSTLRRANSDPSGKGDYSWRLRKARNAHTPSALVPLLLASIAARSARRWKRLPTLIAPAHTPDARAIPNNSLPKIKEAAILNG